jgi:hypothetical protein
MAELLLNDADDDFSPNPPTWDQIDFDYTIESIIGLLNQATRGNTSPGPSQARCLQL